ncbi:hypothetical protein G0U57_013836, partial [Chelydra serpentina]
SSSPPPALHTQTQGNAAPLAWSGKQGGPGEQPGRKLQPKLAQKPWVLPPPDKRLFQQEEIHVRNKMSHAERPHRDKQHQYYESHGSDRHHEERRAKKPYLSNGR